jgi:1-deoxy-D-xylulose-5-phosphate synthase
MNATWPQSPKALREVDAAALPHVCAALRAELIAACARTGGHLGASLGAVELVVALHRVFRTPVDQLVFDVGHQAYAHKLLTGRGEAFSTLRQAGGLHPFLSPAESRHDAFAAGHAGTAISVALGLLEAKRHRAQPGQVVAVVGDGALTSGLTFEGLNNAAVAATPLKVVLNDNGMSISQNVGGVTVALREARRFFEPLGFTVLGPVDGHDIEALVAAVRTLAASHKSAVLHVKTEKGRGFAPAEADGRTRGHAMGPFELRDGKLVRQRVGKTTFSEAFAASLERVMAKRPEVVAITPAMLEGSALVGLAQRFSTRVYDVGIAEAHALTFAAGLAAGGLKPVVCIYSTFLQRAFDSLVHDIALPQLPVVLAVDRAGLVGADGATHQGSLDVAFARCVPGLKTWAPVTGDDLEPLLEAAVSGAGPVMLRFPRGVLPEVSLSPVESAKARWLVRPPNPTLCFITLGPLGLVARDAVQGQPWAVLDALAVAPLDEEAIVSAAMCGRLVTVEEGTTTGGLGSAVLELLARRGLTPKVRVLGLPADRAMPHGEAWAQRAELGLDAAGLRAVGHSRFG